MTTPPEPRPAATVIVVRPAPEADARPEVLLLRRHASAGFMANVWVFPGGRVDEADLANDDAHRAAAIRETAEEAGIALSGELAFCAHWVTPVTERKRFDTRFFVTTIARGAEATPDTTEVTEAVWLGAGEALARHRRGELPLAPPTWLVLHDMATLSDCAAVMAWGRAQQPRALMPTLELVHGKARVVSPVGTLVLEQGHWELVPADG